MSFPGSGTNNDNGLNGLILPGIFVALVIGVYLWFSNQAQETALRASATGFDGLAQWLKAEGSEVEVKTSIWPASPEGYGLRVLPSYDSNLAKDRLSPTTEDDLFSQSSERDEDAWRTAEKVTLIPTLFIMPKWRTGMRLSRRVHDDFMGNGDHLGRHSRIAAEFPGKLTRTAAGFQRFAVQGTDLVATIYSPQVFENGKCKPLIGTRKAMILGECKSRGLTGEPEFVWMLSDPDLLNNHGLTLGDNARIAAMLLPDLANGGKIVVDYTTSVWVQVDAQDVPERTWSDLLRFFAYPFSLLWIGSAAFMALAIWRSWARYGAPLRAFNDEMSASKDMSVAAKARLLRLSGHDGALVAAHAAQRLHELAATVFGPHRKQMQDPLPHITTWLARRDSTLANRFEAAATSARDLAPTTPTSAALQALDEFETCYERVLDDFGGTPGRS
ncbi:MAG: hypothetical protein ACPGVA_15745 [Pikeienuella sp.]